MPINPDYSQIMNNPEMVDTAMNIMKNNPEILKNMGSMLGKDHPMSKYLKNSSPEDL